LGAVTTIQQRLEALRALSHEAPEAQAWARLWGLLQRWPMEDDLQVGLDYAHAALEGWPDALRRPPPGALTEALSRGHLPHPWPLVRHLEESADQSPPEELLTPQHLRALSGLGAWAPLRHIHLRGQSLGNAGARELAEASALANARSFTFRNQHCGPDGARAMLGSRDAAQLERLDLSLNTLWDEGGQILADARHLTALRHLDLDYTDLGAAGLRALGQAVFFPALVSLDISVNPLEEEALAVLRGAHSLKHLGMVDMDMRLTPQGMGALAHDLNLSGLESLELGYTPLTSAELSAWRGADFAASLRHLLLRGVELPPEGLESLLAALPGAPMRTLRLDQNRLTLEHARLLATGPWTALESLDLSDTRLESHTLQTLLSTSAMDKVHTLRLSQNRLDAQAVEPLLALARRGALRHLDLRYNDLGDQGALRLAQDPRCAHLETLELGLNNLQEDTWRALRASPHSASALRPR
jgi:Leucine-rich repeat (LRR) protein